MLRQVFIVATVLSVPLFVAAIAPGQYLGVTTPGTLPGLEPQNPHAPPCQPGGGCLPFYVDETGDTMTGDLNMAANLRILGQNEGDGGPANQLIIEPGSEIFIEEGANITFEGGGTFGPVAGEVIAVGGDLTPTENDTFGLGNETNRWTDLFLASQIDYASDLEYVSSNVTTYVLSTGGDATLLGTLTAASFVGDGAGLTGVIAGGLPDDSVTSSKIVDEAVTELDLADNAVSNAKIQDGVITSEKIASSGVLGVNIALGAVGSSQLLDGSVAAADVDVDQIQLRVSGSCAIGSAIRAIATDGTVTCEPDDAAIATFAGTVVRPKEPEIGAVVAVTVGASVCFVDTNGNDDYDSDEALYLDVDHDLCDGVFGTVEAGDIRLHAVGSFAAFTRVRAADADFGTSILAGDAAEPGSAGFADGATEVDYFDADGDATFTFGDTYYLDADDDGVVSVGDLRWTRHSTTGLAGTKAASGDADLGNALLDVASLDTTLTFWDVNEDGNFGLAEPAYIHVDGVGTGTDLEPYDIRLGSIDNL